MMPGRVNHDPYVPTSLPVDVGQSNPFGKFLDAFTDGFRIQSHALIYQRRRCVGSWWGSIQLRRLAT